MPRSDVAGDEEVLFTDTVVVDEAGASVVTAVVVWGTTDNKSWRASQCPLLFNGDYSPKACFNSIIDGL